MNRLRTLLVAAALVAAAAAATWRAPAVQARVAAWRAQRAPRDRWGGPLRPAPLISRGARVAASRPGADVLVDGVYRGPAWAGGFPTPAAPAWVAIRIGRGPTRLLLSWTSSHNHDYRDLFYGAPVDYRIETSADSTDGAGGTWRTEVVVRDNPVRSRAHAVDFAGQRWIRLVVTRLATPVNAWGLFLDEIDVHDLSLGGDDLWVFVGDSIGAGVFDRAPGHRPSFADAIAGAHPGYLPAMIDAGFCRARTAEVLAHADDLLAWNPDARVFAILLGANDGDPAAFGEALDALVARLQAAGRIVMVARIPYQTKYAEDYVAPKNVRLDQVVAARGLLPGPDLYRWFRQRPERLADGLHPDDAGAVATSRLWAEAAAPLYPR
ncbi:MAG TPA: GDSL-type esterase/lipase family protein [Anaeromyxobacter sp.]|nr:GDSL-type esterase/lipase family protein [Anaeromyxobacter sp.]